MPKKLRINWDIEPKLTADELASIVPALQAWQLAETSDGKHLIHASTKYADKIDDPAYIDASRLFIKEEQKHGANLGRYLDTIDQPRVKQNWADSLFRQVRYFNTHMELWTLTVLIVESTAQIFYQTLKDATNCPLLKQVCTDILIDEAHHITFQTERLALINYGKNPFSRAWRKVAYKCFFYATSCMVWLGYRRLFKAGGNSFSLYLRKIDLKYKKTLHMITAPLIMQHA